MEKSEKSEPATVKIEVGVLVFLECSLKNTWSTFVDVQFCRWNQDPERLGGYVFHQFLCKLCEGCSFVALVIAVYSGIH